MAEWEESLCQRNASFMISPKRNGAATPSGRAAITPVNSVGSRRNALGSISPPRSPNLRYIRKEWHHVLSWGAEGFRRETKGIRAEQSQREDLNFLVFDLDQGQPESEFLPKLLDSDLAFVFYPSHSNGKTSNEIDFKKLKRFRSGDSSTPSDATCSVTSKALAITLPSSKASR